MSGCIAGERGVAASRSERFHRQHVFGWFSFGISDISAFQVWATCVSLVFCIGDSSASGIR